MLIVFILDYFGQPVMKDFWNFQPSSEFTLDSGFVNPASLSMYGVNHSQTGKNIFYFKDYKTGIQLK